MREGWEQKTLDEIASVAYGFTDKACIEGAYRYVRITDIDKEGKLTLEEKKYVKYSEEANKFILKDNDLLMARTGATFAKVLLYANYEPSIFASYLIKIEFKKEILNKLYWYFSKSENYREQANRLSSGSAQPHFNGAALKKIIFAYPNSVSEQEQIIAILDEAFATIDQAKANIEKNIENAQDFFQSKLNEIFSQKGEGWEEKTLIEIASEFGRGKSKHRPRNDKKLYEGNYPFVQTGDIRNAEKYVSSYSQTYNEVGLQQSKLWEKGTICITIAANIAETAILGFRGCFPDSIIGLVVNPELAEIDYTYYTLQYLKAELQKLGKGSAQDNINLGTFKDLKFPFPDLKTQRSIVEDLDDLKAKVNRILEVYDKKIFFLNELKKSLLQKAFSGELSKKDIKEIAV